MAKPCTQVVLFSVFIAQCPRCCCGESNQVNGDDDLKTFPNLGYLLSGYNIFRGNPQTSSAGVDPGFTSATQIYDTVFSGRTTSDGRYKVPDNITIKKDYGCAVDFSSSVTFKTSDYKKGLKLSVSADFGGFDASFSASLEYASFEQYTTSSNMKMVRSTAECVQYTGGIDEYTPPKFSDNFQIGVSQLPDEYGNGEQYFDFIDDFGTHMVTGAIMGARFGFSSYLDEESSKKIEETNVTISVAASYEGIVKVGGSVSDDATKKAQEEFSKTSRHLGIISLGAKPTSTDATQWAKQAIEEPMPIKYSLRKICAVLKQDQRKMANCNMALNEYCQKRLRLTNCGAPNTDLACVWDSDCHQGQGFQCVDNRCVQKPPPKQEIRSNDVVHLKHVASGLYFKDVQAAGHRKSWPHGRLGEPEGNFEFLFENPVGPKSGDGRTLLRIRSKTTTDPGYNFMYASDQGGIYFDLDTPDEDKQWWKITKVTAGPWDSTVLRDDDVIMLENKHQPGTYLTKYQSDWVYSLEGKDAWQIHLSRSEQQHATLVV